MVKKLLSLLVPIPFILNIQPVSSTTSPERKLIADAIKLYNRFKSNKKLQDNTILDLRIPNRIILKNE